jgi:hypothetical protein
MSRNGFRSAVPRNSVSPLSTLKKCIALTVFGTGVLSAAPPPCPVAPLTVYEAFGSTGCTITATTAGGNTVIVLFSQFKFTQITPSAPLDSALTVTPLADGNGIGFSLTPTVPWTAPLFHSADDEIQYIATVLQNALDWVGINSLYTELQGTATPPGVDEIIEVYCPGGTTLPPDQNCPGANGQAPTIFVFPSVPNAGVHITFQEPKFGPGTNGHGSCTINGGCVYTSIAVLKDMAADASKGGAATTTLVKNQFGPPIQPCTCMLAVIGNRPADSHDQTASSRSTCDALVARRLFEVLSLARL